MRKHKLFIMLLLIVGLPIDSVDACPGYGPYPLSLQSRPLSEDDYSPLDIYLDKHYGKNQWSYDNENDIFIAIPKAVEAHEFSMSAGMKQAKASGHSLTLDIILERTYAYQGERYRHITKMVDKDSNYQHIMFRGLFAKFTFSARARPQITTRLLRSGIKGKVIVVLTYFNAQHDMLMRRVKSVVMPDDLARCGGIVLVDNREDAMRLYPGWREYNDFTDM